MDLGFRDFTCGQKFVIRPKSTTISSDIRNMYMGPFVAPTTWSQRKSCKHQLQSSQLWNNPGLEEVGQVPADLCESECLSAFKISKVEEEEGSRLAFNKWLCLLKRQN